MTQSAEVRKGIVQSKNDGEFGAVLMTGEILLVSWAIWAATPYGGYLAVPVGIALVVGMYFASKNEIIASFLSIIMGGVWAWGAMMVGIGGWWLLLVGVLGTACHMAGLRFVNDDWASFKWN